MPACRALRPQGMGMGMMGMPGVPGLMGSMVPGAMAGGPRPPPPAGPPPDAFKPPPPGKGLFWKTRMCKK